MKPLTIAHISDLHFSKFIPSLTQFFSKRWIGNVNLLFARGRVYVPDQLYELPKLFQSLNVDVVFCAGDVSTTSHPQEFALAKDFLQSFQDKDIQTFVVPGNHDQYTRKSYKNQEFYRYFIDEELRDQKVTSKKLSDNWYTLLIDTALATNWISSRGYFQKTIEVELQKTLEKIPKEASIILLNHFPLFQNDSKRKELKRAKELQQLLQKAHPRVKLYLNGHTHRHCIADLRANHYPIVLDSGSTAHKSHGSWNLIHIDESSIEVQPYGIVQGSWQKLVERSEKFSIQQL